MGKKKSLETMPSMGWADGMGVVPSWGNSPAIDLATTMDDVSPEKFALIATGEFSVALKTFAAARLRGDEGEKTAYIIERRPETLVRHCVLLAVAIDHTISLRERTEIFLEVYANTMLSDRGARYIRQRAAALVAVMVEDDTQSVLANAIDLSLLKHKEVDSLVKVAKLWADGLQFESEQQWDERLRQYYKERYNSRKNAADWDFHMKLKELGGQVISSRQFINWRLTGMAFEFGDKSYNKPNFTLGCYAQGRENNRSVERHGYWGDVVNSPYLTHGLSAKKEGLFKKRNNEYVHSASDITKYNATKMLHAFMEAAEIEPAVHQTGIGGDYTETTGDNDNLAPDPDKPLDSFPKAKVMLMLGEPQLLLRRQKYAELFDAMYCANASAGDDLTVTVGALAPGGSLTLETAKYVLDLRREHKTEFLRRIYVSAQATEALELRPFGEKSYQGKGAALTGEQAAHVTLVKAGGERGGTIGFPEIEAMEGAKAQEQPEPEQPAAAEDEESCEADGEMPLVKGQAVGPKSRGLELGNGVEFKIVQRHASRSSNRPRELLVRIKMPGLESISALELNVEQDRVVVKHEADPAVDLDIKLPFPVESDDGSATFDKERCTLSVTLPVVKPEEKPQEALLGLENDAEGAAEDAEGEEAKVGERLDQKGVEHVMAREQKGLGFGMFVPPKLCANSMMF